MHISTYALEVTEDTIPYLIENAAKWQLNVDGEVQGAMEEAAEFGTTCYALLSVNYSHRHATFTTMWKEDFGTTWRPDGATHGRFNRVQLINKK
jgi:hypothetical protein